MASKRKPTTTAAPKKNTPAKVTATKVEEPIVTTAVFPENLESDVEVPEITKAPESDGEVPEIAKAPESDGEVMPTPKHLRVHYSRIGEIEIFDDAGSVMQLDHGRIRGEYILRVIHRAQ